MFYTGHPFLNAIISIGKYFLVLQYDAFFKSKDMSGSSTNNVFVTLVSHPADEPRSASKFY